MSWIKRNLFFVIGSVVALALMGLAGWSLYSKWTLNQKILTDLNSNYEELKGLASKNPHPGNAKVDNIKNAKEQQLVASNYVAKARAYFEPISRLPSPEDSPKITDRDFTTALSKTVDQMQKQAAASSVNLVTSNYYFSFEALKGKVSFDPKGLLPLATQLGEVKAICDVLFQAKINSLENIRRERVAPEDSLGGLQTDYLTEKKTTNELAVLTPYEVVFKCFSSELAMVLGGFASSPHGLIVKSINVEGAPITPSQEQPLMPGGVMAPGSYYTQPVLQPTAPSEADVQAQIARRYGMSGNRGVGRYGPGPAGGDGVGIQYRGLQSTPTYNPPPVAPRPAMAPTGGKPGVLPTVLDERQLKVTVNLILVKLLPAK